MIELTAHDRGCLENDNALNETTRRILHMTVWNFYESATVSLPRLHHTVERGPYGTDDDDGTRRNAYNYLS